MVLKGIHSIVTTPPHHINLIDDVSGGFAEPVLELSFRSSITTPFNDIWTGVAATIPIPPQPGGQQMQIQSSSASDTAAGTGIQTLMIHYLDSSGNDQTETKTMNGTTPVLTTATNIRFVNELHALTVGSNNGAVGTITITPAATPATVYNQIDPNNNIDLSSQFMVPAGKVLLIQSFTASGGAAAGGKSADIRLRSTSDDGLLLPTNVFVSVDNLLIFNSGVSKVYLEPVIVPPLGIVKCTAFGTAAGADVQASYQGILVPVPT